MTGKELLEKLQTFSKESLNQEVYICGADCLVNNAQSIFIQREDYTDEDGIKIPSGTLVIDW